MDLFGIVEDVLSPITGLIKEAIPDKDLAKKLSFKIRNKLQERLTTVIKAKRDVIVAEANGESWIQQSWRPILMLCFTAIIVNNYILSPYLQAMFSFSVKLQIPTQMWELLKIGIGGYIGGRSLTKAVRAFKGGDK